MSDSTEKHLKSIDKTLKALAKQLGVPDDEGQSFADTTRRLIEPLGDDRRRALEEMAREGQRDGLPNTLTEGGLRRLTEPGEPATATEGDYLLNPDADKTGV